MKSDVQRGVKSRNVYGLGEFYERMVVLVQFLADTKSGESSKIFI